MRVLFAAAACVLLEACSLFALDGFSGEPLPADASTDATAGGDAPANDAGTSNDATTTSDGDAPSKYRAAVALDVPYAHFALDDATGPACESTVATSVVCLYPSSQATRGVAGVAGSTAVHLDAPAAALSVSGLIGDFAKPFSIELWLRMDAVVAKTEIFYFAEPVVSSPGDGSNMFFDEDGLLRYEVWYSKALISYGLAATPLAPNAWHHVVVTHSTEPDRDLLYVDGVAAVDRKTDPGTRPTTTKPLVLSGFVGAVDEIALYDHALEPERIAAHYAAQ